MSPQISTSIKVADNSASAKYYSLNDLSKILGKSRAILYRRLTEKSPKYKIRFAQKEGSQWVFPKRQIDDALDALENIIVRSEENSYTKPCPAESEGDVAKIKLPSNIRKHGSIYYVRVQKEKKRCEVPVGTNEADAIKVRNKLLNVEGSSEIIPEKATAPSGRILFKQAVKEHWRQHLKHKKSGSSMLQILTVPISCLGDVDIKGITWRLLENYRNDRLDAVAASWVRKELFMIGAVLERQVRMGNLTQNVVRQVEKPKVNDVRERIPTDAEFRKLLSARWELNNRGFKTMKGIEPHIRLALIIADYTAMRISEILAMTWNNTDLVNGFIIVPTSKSGKSRLVPIHPELKRILENIARTCEFVIGYQGRGIKNSIRKGFTNARTAAKLGHIWIHDFRHRAITRWVREGKPVNVIMKASGHSTMSAFLRYSNLQADDVQMLVGGTVVPIPVITYEDFLAFGEKCESGEESGEMGKTR